jgi:hypothetical protein
LGARAALRKSDPAIIISSPDAVSAVGVVPVHGELVLKPLPDCWSNGVALLPENSANCAAMTPLVWAGIVGAASAPVAILYQIYEPDEIPRALAVAVQPEGAAMGLAEPVTAAKQISRLPAVLFSLVPHAGVTAVLTAPPCEAAPIVPTSA